MARQIGIDLPNEAQRNIADVRNIAFENACDALHPLPACQSAPRDFAIELGADMMLADAFLDPDVPEQSFFQVREEASLASRAAYQLREQSCVIGHLQCVVRLLEPGRRPGG